MPSKTKRNLNQNASKYYSAGSAAPSVAPVEYPNPNIDEPRVSPRRKPRPRQDPQRKEAIKNKALYYVKFLVTSVIILTGCITVVMFDSIIYEKQNNIRTLERELKSLQDENLGLQTNISEQVDLKNIEKEARRLGMGKPAKYQIVYIDVPKSSYTVQYEDEIVAESTSFLDSIKSFVKSFFK